MKFKGRGISTTVAVVIIVVVLVVAGFAGYYAGISGVAASTVTITGATSTVSGQATQTQVDLAKAECAKSGGTCVTIYSTIDSSSWISQIQPLLYATYPWLTGKVNYVGLSSSQLTSRGISEFKAGNIQADVFQSTVGPLFPVIQAGAVQNYSSPLVQAMNYSSDAYDHNGQWVVVFRSIPVLTYNPQQLAALNLPTPTKWQDMGNPIYKGHIGMQTGTSLSATFSIFYYLLGQMGNSSWTQLMNAIAANKPVLTSGAGDTTSNVVSGRVAIGISLFDDYEAAKTTPNATGSIDVVPNTAVTYNPSVVSLAAKAPHPQTGKLVYDWLISSSGQAGLALSYRPPYNAAISTAFGLQPPGTNLVNAFPQPGTTFANPGYWSDLMKSIYGG